MITLALLGLFSMDAYETRRDNQKLLQLESKPLKKREGVFCPFLADSGRAVWPWLFRHT
jgi:hypothetical protein